MVGMPIDKGRETGGNDQPDDRQRIETERAQRDALSRKHDELHDPSPEFEQAARALPEEYGSHRPKHLELTPEQVAEIEEFTGKSIEHVLAVRDTDPRAGHNRDEHGRILDPHGNPRGTPDVYETLRKEGAAADIRTSEPDEAADGIQSADHGDAPPDRPRPSNIADANAFLSDLAEELRSGQLTPSQAADRLEAFSAGSATVDGPAMSSANKPPTDALPDSGIHNEADADQTRTETNAWDTVEGEKPDRENIHVNQARRIHILDGDGDGDGGHLAGTGVPGKTEFPGSWDDEKVVRTIEDIARNPDHIPRIQDNSRWVAAGTRDGVEVKVIMNRDGRIWTAHPIGGTGVIHNDEHGNPKPS